MVRAFGFAVASCIISSAAAQFLGNAKGPVKGPAKGSAAPAWTGNGPPAVGSTWGSPAPTQPSGWGSSNSGSGWGEPSSNQPNGASGWGNSAPGPAPLPAPVPAPAPAPAAPRCQTSLYVLTAQGPPARTITQWRTSYSSTSFVTATAAPIKEVIIDEDQRGRKNTRTVFLTKTSQITVQTANPIIQSRTIVEGGGPGSVSTSTAIRC